MPEGKHENQISNQVEFERNKIVAQSDLAEHMYAHAEQVCFQFPPPVAVKTRSEHVDSRYKVKSVCWDNNK